MKTIISVGSLVCLLFLLTCCNENKDFSTDYDIEWPVSSIESISPAQQTVGENIEVTGKNLQHTYNFYIGSIGCEIVSKSENKLVVKVPLNVIEESTVSIINLYNRTFTFSGKFTPLP
ncbi:hypothetical protein EZS27_021822 [termite gut metagenome]|jgi:hypothetical protein|uniref:IPT/TIG domain-containing protein n=1 Tax=termite gut metagenome TaxID=433724 RepID=A0A5J4R6W9_9ZZZZ